MSSSSKPGISRLRSPAKLALLTLCSAFAWGVGAEAHARAVLLAPLIPARGVPPERVVDLRSIISSELEFMEGIDEVIELGPQPNGVDTSCLTSTSCLGTLAEDHEADIFIGGTLDKSGDNLIIDLLFYDADVNRILRRKTFTVNAASGASLLDQISPIVSEIMTGVSPQKKEAEAAMTDVEFDGDAEEMKFDPKATGIAAPEPRPEPTPPPPAEEFDPNAFSFGNDPTDITFGDPGAITFEPGAEAPTTESIDDPSVAVDEEEDEEPVRTTSTPSRYEEDEDDTPTRSSSSSSSSSSRSSASSPSRSSSSTRSSTTRSGGKNDLDELSRATITTRGGFTHYGIFNFGTVGAEIGVRATAGLYIIAGIDLHIVNRALPPEEAAAQGKAVETNYIFPVNAGLMYRFKGGRVRPYAGADFIASHLRTECIDLSSAGCTTFADPPTRGTVTQGVDYVLKSHWALGGRGRLGLDVMLAPHIGFNADVALGYWRSSDWPNVDPRQPVGGFLAHLGGGLVFGF